MLSEAWRNGGKVWNPVSPHFVTLRLLLSDKEVPGLSVTLISVYAPTYQSCHDVKAEFYNDLQVLDSVPKDDLLISMSDFNARVGSTTREENSVWHHGDVCGFHDVGEMNKRGENLLSFLC